MGGSAEPAKTVSRWDAFFFITIIAQAILAVLFGVFTTYNADIFSSTATDIDRFWPLYMDVASMVFLGFGFLMTFMHRHSFGAVGMTMLVAVFCIQWGILCIGVAEKVHSGHWNSIVIDTSVLINAQFCAASVLISFGAIIGKVSPQGLLFMAFFECILYAINKVIIEGYLQVVDIGGSMSIHAFGAYFGLAVTALVSPKTTPRTERQYHHGPESVYSSDIFAMLGTVFLWLYWPSFNGALAPQHAQLRAVINTLLSLCACALTAYTLSRFFRGGNRVHMIDLQNATLAGGVAAGASADSVYGPGVAIAVGMCAAAVSVVGYNVLQPRLERLGLRDTCGVNNLHGMPGILATVVSAIAFRGFWNQNSLGDVAAYTAIYPNGANTGGYQMAGLCVTLGIAIVGGLGTGLLMRLFIATPETLFSDEPYFHVPVDFSDPHTVQQELPLTADTPTAPSESWPEKQEQGHVFAADEIELTERNTTPAATPDVPLPSDTDTSTQLVDAPTNTKDD